MPARAVAGEPVEQTDRQHHGRLAGRSIDQKVVVGVVYVVAMFTTILDSTVVNVALPSMARDFHVHTASIEWVVTGYLLSLAVFIPASGWIGDRVGTKRIFLLALLLFTVASALCGLASSLGELVAFRILQGVGGGMLMPVGTAMLYRAFPPAQRARANAILIVPTVVAPAAGPVLGGLLVDTLSWRWV
ncbi:MAG TPA: MFS transporter, partial [Acidimicrobiales bacterium]|nr:MFS transporter [Acidimicrobiales bacterium]